MLSSLLRHALPPRLHSRHRSAASASSAATSDSPSVSHLRSADGLRGGPPSDQHHHHQQQQQRRRNNCRRSHKNTPELLPPIRPQTDGQHASHFKDNIRVSCGSGSSSSNDMISPMAPVPPYLPDGGREAEDDQKNLSRQHPSPTVIRARQLRYLSERTPESLREMFYVGKNSGDWHHLKEFYLTLFESFHNMVFILKVKDEMAVGKHSNESLLNKDMMDVTYDLISDLPLDLQKLILKSIISCLLKDRRLYSVDDLRAYFILLQNPLFESNSTFRIFAHLVRQVAALNDEEHHYLVHWIKELEPTQFKAILSKLNCFITWKIFPAKLNDLPHPSKCTWWVPSAVKVMALLNAANNLVKPYIILFEEFYNERLNQWDLLSEYYKWQSVSSHGGFSFCQYPFLLSISAKRTILQRDSEQQMIVMARRSLVDKVQKRQLPDIGMLFLNLHVRRSHLVSDSLNEIANKQKDLKKKLKVTFTGEPGLDMGGLTKEWFLLLIRQIFHPDYGMFTFDKRTGVYWFNCAPCNNYQEFHLVGVLMGLAVYNSIMLDIRFPPCCYKKLLSPPVVPYSNERATVGVANLTLNDLKPVHYDVSKGLQELLDYEGDVEEDFGLTFQVSHTELGCVKTHPLKRNGENIAVTNSNRQSYVQLYVTWVLNKSIYEMFKQFYLGFHSVCASNALIMLRPEEVEMLVCGCPTLDLRELKQVVTYNGYSPTDVTIKHFWDVILKFPMDLQKKLLLFTTGSDRVPIGGTSDMSFKITKVEDQTLLPMSHTCFNQLVLPSYKSKKTMKAKLLTAIQNAEGFGLE